MPASFGQWLEEKGMLPGEHYRLNCTDRSGAQVSVMVSVHQGEGMRGEHFLLLEEPDIIREYMRDTGFPADQTIMVEGPLRYGHTFRWKTVSRMGFDFEHDHSTVSGLTLVSVDVVEFVFRPI